LCIINKNFSSACQDQLFWWKIIEIKYPKYIIYKYRDKYNSKIILEGINYFLNDIIKFMHVDITDNCFLLDEFINNYYETFRYLILTILGLIRY